ncbi:MAG: hypothetical protein PQJ60_01900 [Spirochaetales bacterium]|nr:hypothetical protein [Spirochaetales bacterium]
MSWKVLLLSVLFCLFLSCSPDQGSESVHLSFFLKEEKGIDGEEGRESYFSAQLKEKDCPVGYTVQSSSGMEYMADLHLQLSMDRRVDGFTLEYDYVPIMSHYGYLMPLDDLLEKMPHYRARVSEQDLNKFRVDGQLYAFPYLSSEEDFHGLNTQGCALRTDWLETLGLDAPETIEEWEEVLRAFTLDDPDRNGLKDTVGLSLNEELFPLLWGAYGIPYVSLRDSWFTGEEGLTHTSEMAETGEMLMLLARWYDLGYVNLDLFERPGSEIFREGKTGCVSLSVEELAHLRTYWEQNGIEATATMMTPFSGPTGEKGYPYRPGACKGLALSAKLTEEEQEAMVSLIDWMADVYPERGRCLAGSLGTQPHQHRSLSVETGDTGRRDYDEERITDYLTLNKPENLLILKEELHSVNSEAHYFYLNGIWPVVVMEVLTGVRDIDAWEEYAAAFSLIPIEKWTAERELHFEL